MTSCTVHLYDIVLHVNSISIPLRDLNKLSGNGFEKCICKCKSKRFQLKNTFTGQNKVASTPSKRIFDCVNPSTTFYLYCHFIFIIASLTSKTK